MGRSYDSHKPQGHVPNEVVKKTQNNVGPGKTRSTDRLEVKQHEGQNIRRSLDIDEVRFVEENPRPGKLTPEQIASYISRFPPKTGDLEDIEMPLFINFKVPDPKTEQVPIIVEREVKLHSSNEEKTNVLEPVTLDPLEAEGRQSTNGDARQVTVSKKFSTKPSKRSDEYKRPSKTILFLMILGKSTAFVVTGWLMLVFGTWIGTLVFIPFIGLVMSIGLLFGSIRIYSMSLSPMATEREKYLWAGGILLSMGSMGLVVSLLYSAPAAWSKFFILF